MPLNSFSLIRWRYSKWLRISHEIDPTLTPPPNPINTQGGDKMAAISRRIFSNEILRILIQISLKFVPNGPINNEPTMVQIMAWRHKGAKPLSEPMMA